MVNSCIFKSNLFLNDVLNEKYDVDLIRSLLMCYGKLELYKKQIDNMVLVEVSKVITSNEKIVAIIIGIFQDILERYKKWVLLYEEMVIKNNYEHGDMAEFPVFIVDNRDMLELLCSGLKKVYNVDNNDNFVNLFDEICYYDDKLMKIYPTLVDLFISSETLVDAAPELYDTYEWRKKMRED